MFVCVCIWIGGIYLAFAYLNRLFLHSMSIYEMNGSRAWELMTAHARLFTLAKRPGNFFDCKIHKWFVYSIYESVGCCFYYWLYFCIYRLWAYISHLNWKHDTEIGSTIFTWVNGLLSTITIIWRLKLLFLHFLNLLHLLELDYIVPYIYQTVLEWLISE